MTTLARPAAGITAAEFAQRRRPEQGEQLNIVLEARLGRGGGGATITVPVLVTKDGTERLSSVTI